MGSEVVDPQGRTWTVRRRWHRRPTPRWRGRVGRLGDVFNGGLEAFSDNLLAGIAVLIVVLVAAVFLIFFGLPLLLFVVESVYLLLVVLFGIVTRVVFGRPWVVEAVSDDPTTAPIEVPVVGWGASRREVESLRRRVAMGTTPRPPLGDPGSPRPFH